MYYNEGLPWQEGDRQYLIITDDEEDETEEGYKIRELSLFRESPKTRNVIDADRHSYLSEEFISDCAPEISLQDNNSRTDVEFHDSKSTQTFVGLHDQGVNTNYHSSSIHTQTIKEDSYIPDDNSYNNKMECSPNPQIIPLADPKLIHFANKMAKVLRVKPAESSHSTTDELSEKYSVIYTYSLNKNKDSKSCYIECGKSQCSSTSYEDLSISESEHIQNLSSVIESEPFKENEMMLYLDQECTRYSYLPNESSNQGTIAILWEYFKVYEVKKFDEIIKSHLNHSDRRLKAISNRMCCKIEIIGPYNPSYFQHNPRNATEWYKMVIFSNTPLRLEKSINCIQLSFPNSCFNEKLYKFNQNQNQY